MNAQMQKIGVLTGGGDCAGLNPAIKWVVKTAMDIPLPRGGNTRYEVLGIRDGWKGLFEVEVGNKESEKEHTMPLDPEIVRTWDRFGGTMLGTSRWGPYNSPEETTSKESRKVLENIKELGLHALIVIGGDGTLAVAHKLAKEKRHTKEKVNIIGIPKTIDKDLPGTDYTLGFETALNVIVEEVDRLRTTAGSHKRIFVIETMGRTAGWLALEGGEACGAYIILIPEHHFEMSKVNELIRRAIELGNRYEIILVAEGASIKGHEEVVRKKGLDRFQKKAYGGISKVVAREIKKGTKMDTQSLSLSYLQRGGAPCAYDRRMGRYFGIAAVDLVFNEEFGKMVCVTNGKISSISLETVYEIIKEKGLNRVDVKTQYDPERYNGRRTILNSSK